MIRDHPVIIQVSKHSVLRRVLVTSRKILVVDFFPWWRIQCFMRGLWTWWPARQPHGRMGGKKCKGICKSLLVIKISSLVFVGQGISWHSFAFFWILLLVGTNFGREVACCLPVKQCETAGQWWLGHVNSIRIGSTSSLGDWADQDILRLHKVAILSDIPVPESRAHKGAKFHRCLKPFVQTIYSLSAICYSSSNNLPQSW